MCVCVCVCVRDESALIERLVCFVFQSDDRRGRAAEGAEGGRGNLQILLSNTAFKWESFSEILAPLMSLLLIFFFSRTIGVLSLKPCVQNPFVLHFMLIYV